MFVLCLGRFCLSVRVLGTWGDEDIERKSIGILCCHMRALRRSTQVHTGRRDIAMPTLQRAPSCFGPSNLYLDGEWRLDHPQPALPYRLRKEELSKWLNKENASYPGACHEHPHTPPPQQYQWQPRACSLRLRDRSAACMALRGMHVLFVGDSIAEQQFNSYSHLLGADFSRNSTRFQTRWIRRSGNRSRWGRDEGRMEALACDGHVVYVGRIATRARRRATAPAGEQQEATEHAWSCREGR